jgi:hypothetical protein
MCWGNNIPDIVYALSGCICGLFVVNLTLQFKRLTMEHGRIANPKRYGNSSRKISKTTLSAFQCLTQFLPQVFH